MRLRVQMDRQYCFSGTFLRIIGILDTLRVCAIIFPSKKGDADVCSIGVSLSYRKYMASDHFVIPIDTWNYGSETLAQAARRAWRRLGFRVPHAL
jgi:hypothetical protein